MAKIPELMSGRALEHDLKFASDGPMSGLVHGVQALSCSGATLTLKLSETSASGEAQMKSNFLSVDPGGVGLIALKLPAALTNGPDLKGRIVKIHNSTDGYGESILVQDSDANAIAVVGAGCVVEIGFSAQGKPFAITEVFQHIAHIPSATNASSPIDILPALGADLIQDCEKALLFYEDAGSGSVAHVLQYKTGTATLATSTLNITTGKVGKLHADEMSVLVANSIITYTSDNVASDIYIRLFFRILRSNLQNLSDSIA